MNYFFKLKANPENPAYNCVIDPRYKEKYLDKPNEILPFGIRIRSELEKANVNIDSICDDVLMTDVPPWKLVNPIVNFYLAAFKKDNTSGTVYKQLYLEQCSKYDGFEKIFTDGSLKDNKAASAAVSNRDFKQPMQLRLPDGSSVYSAELKAILLALKRIYQSKRKSFLIVSDSLSALEAISTRKLTHPFLVDIHDLYTKLTSEGKIIVFLWAPSHIGIYGNEIADLAAKNALGLDIPKFPSQFVPFTDLRRKTNSYCFQLWQERWSSLTNNKLFKIRPVLSKPFPMAVLTRKEETILARLHTGHTYFTHVHLLKREEPPWCHACDTLYSVRHIMSECADVFDLRESFFGKMEVQDIFTDIPTANLFGFLRETDLFL
jgi:kelch-like protein 2/3